ncbi:PucR C-terminal helix-turn-helix domain-containing protein [Micromonospora nigra]|uniref:PucR C-terminal helix-turn-helix domain-containing protein n=1 Tax=Micromonospora nigra TaxID=145857 RepID=A0A1C6R9R2_9ACTN|nr:helix-turn-helix domain-containing protein [Micromonospora nigra]SCL13861.1 PucR C-terminal helix-turn-helix domain-containing protein [Micromonospora nigra]
MSATATPWQRLPADLAAAMRPHLPATVAAVAVAVTEATPAFAAIRDAKFTRDVRTAVQVALDRFIDLVGTEEPALPPGIREVFVALGAAEAREDRGPEALLAALRMAARSMLRTASESLARLRPVGTGELIDLSDAISAYVDELAAAGTDGYALQLREQAGEGDRRRQLAELLLRGDGLPGAVEAAASRIGWPDLDVVVPVLLPPEQARDARFRFGADGLVVERGRDAVLLLRAGTRTSRAALTDSLVGRGAVVGPALGWARVPASVRLAELTGGLVGPDPGPVFVDDRLSALTLRGETGALAVLAHRRLAPLAHLRPAQQDNLLVTLYSWLRHWGSRADVAAELFVHPQTVSYRLRRLRELYGADLDDAVARFELLLVLARRLDPPTTDGGPG